MLRSETPRVTRSIDAPGHGARRLRIAGMFAGIGGLERGLSQAGHETLLLCEKAPEAREVLRQRFVGVDLHDDIRSLRALPTEASLVAAGFPCQDLSPAGRTRGHRGPQSSLVALVFDLLAEQRPRRRVPWVLLENVPFMLRLHGGAAMRAITQRLEGLGYRWAYRTVDTRAFGLPQRRERVFLLASREDDPRDVLLVDDAAPPPPASDPRQKACGFYWTEGNTGLGWAVDAVPTLKSGSGWGIPSPPAIVLPERRGIVLPHIRDAERLQGFPAGWTEPAEGVGRASLRWRLVGNAVSVPVARWLGERLSVPGAYDAACEVGDLDRGATWPRAGWGEGGVARECALSTAPVRVRRRSLDGFLIHEPRPLSARATAGFLSRLLRSSLNFEPWFEDALRRHLRRAP